MAYNDLRSYTDQGVVAQNIVSTASGAVATSTTTGWLPINEATFIVSIAGVITATPAAPPANTSKYVLLSGTNTVGSVSPTQAVGSSAFSTITPPYAVAQGSALSIVSIGTGTASATQTMGAVQISVGVAPQFV